MRWLVVFLIGAVLGTAFGVAVGFFAFPYIFPPPPAVEELRSAEANAPVARGTFIHANPSDPIHYGQGTVTVFGDLVFLHEDFKVGPGPSTTSIWCRRRPSVRRAISTARCSSTSGGCAPSKAARTTRFPPGSTLRGIVASSSGASSSRC